MRELGTGLWRIAVYFVSAASCACIVRLSFRIPEELFRKLLHLILLGSLPVFVFGFERWWVSAGTAVLFELVVYPILRVLERLPRYSAFVTERKSGELKSSLLLVFTMFAVVIAVCWGRLGDRWLVLASIYAWGFGDAAAALVGKRFGRHRIVWPGLDGKKSYEGSAAMLLVSFVSVAVLLTLRGGLAPLPLLAVSFVTAAVSALSELYTRGGYDTVTCPLSAMAVLLPLLAAMGGL